MFGVWCLVSGVCVFVAWFYLKSLVGFCVCANVSFICNPSFSQLYMRNYSDVLSVYPFFARSRTADIWSHGTNAYAMRSISGSVFSSV